MSKEVPQMPEKINMQEALAEKLEQVPEQAKPLVMSMLPIAISMLLSGIEIGKEMEMPRPA
jgi:hypothetical protein